MQIIGSDVIRSSDVVKPPSITTARSRAENTYRKVENTECVGLYVTFTCDSYCIYSSLYTTSKLDPVNPLPELCP